MKFTRFLFNWVLVLLLVACSDGGGFNNGVGMKPTSLSYERAHDVLVVGVASVVNKPEVTGGYVEVFSVDPDLPAGLHINLTSGEISGTPLVQSPLADYVVTASNAQGSASTTLKLEVKNGSQPPIADLSLAYSNMHPEYIVGQVIPSNVPLTSASFNQYEVAPALPHGLVIDPATGVISGQPTELIAEGAYTITARNAQGSSTAVLLISVSAQTVAPSGFLYPIVNVALKQGQVVPAGLMLPSYTGTVANSFSLASSVNLPAGLSLNPNTGEISGTPSSLSISRIYTIQATNSAGSAKAFLRISVSAQTVAPSGFLYPIANIALKQDQTVPAGQMLPSYNGSVADSFTLASSAPLPAGLSLNPNTGEISGTPSNLSISRIYTVQATNSAGSAKAFLRIMVTKDEILPSSFEYPDGRSFQVGEKIELAPALLGGTALTGFTLTSGSLPIGVTLNAKTGMMTGLADATAAGSYTIQVKGRNAAGTLNSNLFTFSIQADLPEMPTDLSYSNHIIGLPTGLADGLIYGFEVSSFPPRITYPPIEPKYKGAKLVRFEISSSLPPGMKFNKSTGVISGHPYFKLMFGEAFVITGFDDFGRNTSVNVFIETKYRAVFNAAPVQVNALGSLVDVAPTMYTWVAADIRTEPAENLCRDLGYRLINGAEALALANLQPLQTAEWPWNPYGTSYKTRERDSRGHSYFVDLVASTLSIRSQGGDYDFPRPAACATELVYE
ncbi:Ig domain-containing protein [Iodobacter fluviatilis]|uniref:Uncharacterized protein n=1 Tax=Iodobacter fluviatilis TaxID=537 RepID=A0A7G3G5Q7_9NEIS|nr:Ig domain-containing protein [Iodobacter fluviatilis]QBC42621.1 hypothetical protein C1H71_02985 [Iodobacter fluviatilis]